jgi:hypothetical protein
MFTRCSLALVGAERGPAQITVRAEQLGCAVGFAEQFVRGGALIVLGCGNRATQKQRPVHRQRLRAV